MASPALTTTLSFNSLVKMSEKMRLQKWAAEVGAFSRHQADRYISEGFFAVNGTTAVPGTTIDPNKDHITFQGKPLKRRADPKVYWLFNKPDKTLTSRKGPEGIRTIFDVRGLNGRKGGPLVQPVGRLDYRSQGLLLLTNDGDFANRICHPRFKIPKVYKVLTDRKLTTTEARTLNEQGIVLEDGPARCRIQFVKTLAGATRNGFWYEVTVWEGRNRLVRRIFEALAEKCRVHQLVRIAVGELRLPEDLPEGSYRALTRRELAYFTRL